MDYSERNRKVAIARWSKIHKKERERIKTEDYAIIQKAAICGFIAGDGNIQIHKEKGKKASHYQVRFYPDDKLMLKKYLKAIDYIYGKQPSITIRDNVFNLGITSRTIVGDLKNTAEFGLYKWSLPYSLFSISGTKEAWLRAFFSAEGYVTNKVIRIQTVNKVGMLSVSKLLKELNIDHKYYEYKPKNEHHSLVSIIVIMKKEARKQFSEKVGFWHSSKARILRKSLSL